MTDDVEAAVEVFRSGWLTTGPRTRAFEEELAAQLGAGDAVAVSSPTAAFTLALRLAGVTTGDAVLVGALAGARVPAAVRAVGAQPTVCDVRAPTDLGLELPRGDGRARVAIYSHTGGVAWEPGELEGRTLVEDATEALFATYRDGTYAGTRGRFGCLSLAAGAHVDVSRGGVLLCASGADAERARLLRSHAMTSTTWDRHRGHAASYDVVDVGFNFRLDEPRAELARRRLDPARDKVAARRRRVAEWHAAADPNLVVLPPPEDLARSSPLHTTLVAETRERRDALVVALGLTPAEPLAPAPPRAADFARRALAVPWGTGPPR